MNPYEAKVQAFHQALDLHIDVPFTPDLLVLRKKLLEEEMHELTAEIDKAGNELAAGGKISVETRAALLKELADLQYVLSGTAVTFGLPAQTAFDRVHESNMSKLDDNGKPIRREDGKVLKGPNYRPPVLDDLV